MAENVFPSVNFPRHDPELWPLTLT